jgi:hypothetical protein
MAQRGTDAPNLESALFLSRFRIFAISVCSPHRLMLLEALDPSVYSVWERDMSSFFEADGALPTLSAPPTVYTSQAQLKHHGWHPLPAPARFTRVPSEPAGLRSPLGRHHPRAAGT